MSKTILLVSNAPAQECELLRNTCARVRSLVQNTVSGYYGDDLARLNRGDEIETMDIGFVLLALTAPSFRKESIGFAIEHRVLKRVLKDQIPMGIICDASSRITAPHLVGGILELVKVLGMRSVEPTCSPNEVYPNARVMLDPKLDIHIELAEQIASLVGPKRLPLSEAVPKQMAAAMPQEGGWAHPGME